MNIITFFSAMYLLTIAAAHVENTEKCSNIIYNYYYHDADRNSREAAPMLAEGKVGKAGPPGSKVSS